ncbi:MAG: DNA polymerase III subunit gamma/tau [Patescibacteria group bacterium]
MAIAIYRRYRPKLLREILGQEAVSEILGSAAKRDRIAHAYLFFGARGTGKTTVARILAKLANCETRNSDKKFRAEGEPCNRCRPCTEIDEGRALDVVEIDAASNRGIDEIRELKESVKLSPSSYRFKVFIIDEAHQLTKEAWNALLKTLEEPPPHAIFILATSEYEKVPPTIISRTQRFHFRRLPLPIISKKLTSIVAADTLNVDPDAIELIAAAGDGSLRDAESLLEQLTSLEETVTLDSVERIIGRIGIRKTAELAEHILKGNLPEALTFIAKVHAGGWNVVDLTKELIHYLRRAATLKFDPEIKSLFAEELTPHEMKLLEAHAALVTSEHLVLMKAIISAYSEMRYSPFATVPLEVALITSLKK